MEARMAVLAAIAAFAVALVLGLVPISTSETGDFPDSVACGSAWAPETDSLTGTGEAACAEGGLNSNRSLSFAALAAAAVFLVGALVLNNRGVAASTSQATPGTEPDAPAANATGEPPPDDTVTPT